MSAAAIVNARMNQVLRKMMDAGAVSPQTAQAVQGLGLRPQLMHKRALYLLCRRGVLVQTAPDTYYVDAEGLRRMQRSQWAVFRVLIGLLAAMLLGVVLMVVLQS